MFESPLDSWHEELASGRGGVFSADKLAALAVVLGIILSQVSLVTPPAGASGAAATALDDAYVVTEGGSLSTVGGTWHLPGWRLRRSITFNNFGREQLDDFPILVRLDPVDIDYTRTQTSGQDLRFADADGTPLDYEIEDWNTGSVSYVWVRVPQIDAGSTSDSIWMYYDNGSIGDGQNPGAVWSNGYVGVWHMDQNPGASQILDSTSYLNHGSANDMSIGDLQPGQMGDGLYFDGSTGPTADFVRVPSDGTDELSFSGASPQLTLEAWVKRTGTPPADWMTAIGRQVGASWFDGYFLASKVGQPDVATFATSDGVTQSELHSDSAAIPFDEWRYLTAVRNGSNMFVYSNGSEVGTTTAVSSIATDNNDVTFGGAENDATTDVTESWLGLLDEIRISNVPRSADWVNAQHASMIDTFVALGLEEEGGVLANDSDPESDPMTAVWVAGPNHAGAFGLNLDGSFNYTPVVGMSGTDSFTYVANDSSGDSNVATVTITVTATGPNNPPDAIDDPSEATDQDTPVVIDVLANDTDADPDPLTVNSVTQGTNGSVVNNTSDVTYTPNASWTGVDTFTYTVADGNSGFDTATVTVTVIADVRGFWRFEEPSGTVAVDSSSYGNDGTYDAPAARGTGVVSTGLDLTGTDDWVIVPDPVDGSLDFGSGDFTISLWVRTTQVPASGAYPEIVWKRTSGATETGFEMYLIEAEANRLAFDLHENGADLLTRGTPIDDGLWHHVAAVRGSSVVLYIDGVEVDSTVDTFGDISNSGDLIFGRDPDAFAWSEFDGNLDEVKIYGRALSPAEIAVLATPGAATSTISGTVFEDIVGDVLNDGTIGDGNNPGTENVDVYLYLDDGDTVLDAGDTLIGGAAIQTDINGDYSFTGLADGHYFVVVDSKTVSASQDPAAIQTDIWAEQTYGPVGGYCDNGGGYSIRVSAGPCYGGIAGHLSDDFSQWDDREHRSALTVSGSDISSVDFGFSFNVVTNTVGGNAIDYDAGTNRTVQGSLRHFIQNANAIAGTNTMRFVPTETAGTGDGLGNWWWRLTVTTALPTVTGDGTTVDGRAFDFTDGTTILDPNTAQIGAGLAVGTDGTYTTPKLDPELEIWNLRSVTVVPTGLVFEASDAVLRHVSIWGFGDTAGTFDTNVRFGTNFNTDPDFTGSLAEFNVIGTGPASFTDPGAGIRSGQHNLTMRETDNAIVRDNLIGFAGSAGVSFSTASNSGTVLRNEVRRNGILNPIGNPIGVWIAGDVYGNLVIDNASGISSGPTPLVEYADNTITLNGWGTTRPNGIHIYGSSTIVQRNVITDNYGAGVVVQPTLSSIVITRNSFSGNGTGNGQIGIDLLKSGDDPLTAPFVTLNDDADADVGANGLLNYPVLDTATIAGTDLIVTGWVKAGGGVELYIAAADPTGFGEGETWLTTLVEGSVDDSDSDPGAYGPGAINGLLQGEDATTERFTFTIPLASLPTPLSPGDELTGMTFSFMTSEFGGNVAVRWPLVVNSTGDLPDLALGDGVCDTGGTVGADSECTLRAAIEQANAFAGADTIVFNIPITDPGYSAAPVGFTIQPGVGSPLPAIGEQASIDGTTQPEFATASRPVVEIDGSLVGGNGLEILASNSEIRGLIINRFKSGIAVLGGDGSVIAGNYLGPDVTGLTGEVGNTDEGILVYGATNTVIGGTDTADRNIISGNRLRGINVDDFTDGAPIISSGTQVLGNYIGTNAAGAASLPYNNTPSYQQIGLYLLDSPNGAIGTAAAGNLISGNAWYGIYFWGANATGNEIQGNIIGLDAAAANPVPNAYETPPRAGILISNAPGNTIGGIVAGEGNIVASNADVGITVGGAGSIGNAILGNHIYDNVDLGIDLNNDGITPNDLVPGDPDAGPNDLLNFPVITGASESAGTVTVDFDLDVPAGDYRIEFFTNMAADIPTGYGEGETFTTFYDVVGHLGVTTSFSVPLAGAGWVNLTATTTEDLGAGSFGSTSEFSEAIPVVRDALVVNSTGDASDDDIGDGVCFTGGTNIDGDPECTLRAAMEEAEVLAGADTVDFNIPINEPGYMASPLAFTLNPASQYPAITGPLTLDATSQPQYTGDPIIQLDGTIAVGATAGLVIEGSDSTIAGFIVHSFQDEGLEIDGIPRSGDNNIIRNNWVGVDASGVVQGNTDNGILITDDATGNLIGGTGPNDGNMIAGSGNRGINIRLGSIGNTVIGNSIYGNTQLGIDLNQDGVTENDLVPGDPDSGPNDLLNFPEITSAVETAGTLVVDFGLDVAAGNYRIEFFTNTAADPSGNGEGETLVATYDVVGHVAGSTSYSTSFAGSTGDILSATSTEDLVAGSFGSTSEFSTAVTVTGAGTTAPVISLVGANPQVIEVGAPYVELGATALDDVDGDITGSIVINASAVNTSVIGSYTVTYDVSDAAGNPATQVTRTVDVVDTAVPVITLVGANPQTIEVGSGYAELGATASDNYDGDLTGWIVINSSAVNTAVLGSYSVTYDVTDSSGNPAVQVVRTVDVVDTTVPVLTLLGANPQTIEVGTPYVELGATATDNYDGDLTGSIVINSSAVNTAVVGLYVVTYDVVDSSGNLASGLRTVNIVDTTAPVITLVGANPQVIEVGAGYTELGATAADNYDGDISGFIVIDATAVNTSVVGSYVVTYDVTDSNLNAAVQVTRTVDVVDTTVPVITLVGANPQTIEAGSPYAELGATASDNYDGDITGSIVINSSAVNTAVVGSYVVTYDVTDLNLNAAVQVTRTVNVVDTTAPVITLVGADPVTVEVGSGYVDAGATAWDAVDGDLTGLIVTVNPVNTSVVGSYVVTYDVTDSNLNAAVQVARTVDVVDTGLPVITLVGADPVTVEVGSPYVDGGATAWDALDGDLTGSIVTVNPVSTAVVGSYVVTYDVTDSNLNAAVQVTRTVDVVDTTLPVISLVGANPQTIEVGSPYAELGATATDNYDGDLTGSITIDLSAVNTAIVGSYVATYDVTDSEGNAAVQATRTVNVADTTVPVITLIGATPQVIEVGGVYTELGATATDNYDGDITGSIVTISSAINTSTVGSYLVTYNVVDSSGNPAGAIRTVNVVDTTPPVITLTGANPQVIEVGSGYTELGATATDNYDGDLTGSIVIDASAVNPAVVGSYVVTYNVTDANGNAATQVTRTVDIVDTTDPVLALTGANPQTIEVGSPYVELGATASDNYDGDITGSIIINSAAVNTAVVGTYIVTYDVVDSSGNPASGLRTVYVVDTTAAVITLVGANPQTIEVGSSYVELGATAFDNHDGDISGSIVIDSAAVVSTVVGSYSVTYDVTDTEGNAATQVTRTVDVVDTTAPVITLVGANPQTVEVGSPYVELGATAFDAGDGDVTGSIVVDSSAVNMAVVGSYPVTYDVTDSQGNGATQMTRTVDVIDTTVPVITLLGANPQVLEVLNPYVELGATATDVGDGDLTVSITTDTSAVNMAAVGSYPVTYNVTDSQGNAAVQATRTVDVVDTTAPVITLVGANPQTIEAGSPYVELGATATDTYDGDITGSVVIDAAAVNTATVGSYPVTYNVTDSEGNAAVQVTRTVDVVDTTAPVIALVGANPQSIEAGSPYVELGATAFDIGDGDLTGSIVIDATAVNTAVLGSYTVTYDVTDSHSNAAIQATRTVDVVDTTLPVIALIGANPQVIEVGSPYVELGATAADNYDGDISGSIVINSGAVNTAVVGSYSVTYDVTDANGNAATQVVRMVNMVDTVAPVITLLGANPQVIEVGSSYTELGATAADAVDGDLTGSIVVDATAVNTGVVGSYSVTYDVADGQGNPAIQVTRSVNVVDSTVPVISLVGANPQVIELGSPYVELGATAADNYDGDITGSIVINAVAVNTAALGSYSVTYDVTDANGNAAVQVTRTVNVVDTTAPVITLVGANPQVIEVASLYVEFGATAFDIGDGDLTGSIVIDAAAVNTAIVGSYAVTYDVTDSQGNATTQVIRTVDVVDTTIPVIALVGANPQILEVGSPYAELGATASDTYDGDISGLIVINASAVNTAVVGSYSVTYDVADASGNAAVQVTRTVDVVDTTLPVITLTGLNPQVIEVGTAYTEVGATAADNYDGDLTGSIVIDATAVNTAMLGSYVVTYDVTDANGNAAVQATRVVDVVDTTVPVISLLGANPQVIEVGTAYTELGATASDNYDGDISGSIVINAAAVNTATVGSYVVTYDVVDSSGNPAFAFRTVDVVDTTIPVISLVGANPQTIDVGSPYAELGATASDNYDGDISGSIAIDASAVNIAFIGSYPVTYDVTDSNGNAAVQLTRTVNVVDTTVPVISLIGANPQSVDMGSPYLELGATASDNYDGDLTGLVMVDASAVNTAVVGTYPVTYDVTDSQGNAAVQIVRTVNVVNVAPTLTFIGNLTVAEGAAATFIANASDPDPTDTLTFSLTGAPTGASIDSVTGVFSWTPTEAQGPNSFAFDVVVSDSGAPALSDSQTVTINVNEVNTAPAFPAIPGQTVDEETLFTLGIPASDVDLPGNTLTYSVSGAPAGLVVNVATGALSWTPTEAQGPGVYTFDLNVVDDGSPSLSDTSIVTVNVGEVNRIPMVVNPGSQTDAEADTIALSIVASDPDVPSNSLSYAAAGLPDGLSIDPVSGVISGVIGFSANASAPYTPTITVTDDGAPALSRIVSFSWDVADTNQAPIAASDGVAVSEDMAVSVAVLANDTDPDDDTLVLSSVSNPSHGSTAITGGAARYTPDANYNGPDSFFYTVSDGRGGVHTAAVAVTVVAVNDTPVATAINSLSVDEGTLATFTVAASDVEGDTLTYSLNGAPAGAVVNSASGVFSWTPSETQGPRSYTFALVVTDSGAPPRSMSLPVRIDVAEVNTPPVVAHPGNQVSVENETVVLRMVATDIDVPAGTIRYSATGLPLGLSIDPLDGEITGTIPFDGSSGSPYSVAVTATDNGSPTRSGRVLFSWTVGNTNRAPTASDVTIFAEAGVPSLLVLNGTDPDGDPLTFRIVSPPTQGALTGGPRLYDYTADATATGTDSFTFSVSDGDLTATGTATISITPNYAPLGGPDEYTVRRGGVLVVDAPGVMVNDRDPEGRSITVAIDTRPAHGSIKLNSDGSFVYSNRGEDVDLDAFTYRVSDGLRFSEPIPVLLIVEENVAPVVVDDTLTLNEDSVAVFHPLDNDYDPNGESIVVLEVTEPSHGSIDWSLDGGFIYIPVQNFNGEDTITYTVSDGDLEASGKIAITIRAVNDPPFATPIEITGHSGEELTIDLGPYVDDVDGDLLDFILEPPVEGTVRHSDAGVFVLNLDGVIHDMAPLTFVVSDPSGAKASSTLTVIVRIPAELVGIPSLVADDLGNPDGSNSRPSPPPPEGTPLLTGLKLMVGSVFDTFQALRFPMFAVLLLALASLYMGLSQKFAFVSTPTALPMSARRKVDIVMSLSGAGVPVRTEPGTHQPVKFRFAATERGVLTTGAKSMVRSEVWIEVETPEGDAWINSEFLTEQIADAAFSDDERADELVGDLIDSIYSSGDLLGITAGHDMHVAYYGPPIRFAANALPRLLRGASVYWWWQPDGDAPTHQGTFDETIGESIAGAYRNRDAHQAEAGFPVPPEFVNMHSLVVGNHEYGEGWRIFFRYENDEPSVAGLLREAQPNHAAMHGEMGLQSA